MGAQMGVSVSPPDAAAFARLGDEGWPLTDYLLHPPGGAPPPIPGDDGRTAARRAALLVLIERAFGP